MDTTSTTPSAHSYLGLWVTADVEKSTSFSPTNEVRVRDDGSAHHDGVGEVVRHHGDCLIAGGRLREPGVHKERSAEPRAETLHECAGAPGVQDADERQAGPEGLVRPLRVTVAP